MNKTLTILLVVALALSFSFGGVFHAVVPHDHDGSEMIWQDLHASLRHDSGKAVPVAWFALWISALVLVAHAISPAFSLVPIGKAERQLHRGIAKYRRFD